MLSNGTMMRPAAVTQIRTGTGPISAHVRSIAPLMSPAPDGSDGALRGVVRALGHDASQQQSWRGTREWRDRRAACPKRALRRALLLRGSSDFTGLDGYRRFLDEVIGQANARRHKAPEIERAKLKSLPPRRTDDHEAGHRHPQRWVLSAPHLLTVPSRLIGHRLRVRLYDDRLECLLGSTLVLTLQRGRIPKGRADRGRCGHVVDYRHVIPCPAPEANGAAQSGLPRPIVPARGIPSRLGQAACHTAAAACLSHQGRSAGARARSRL
jgi:hypothetical protein